MTALLGTPDFNGHWIDDPVHRDWLLADSRAQIAFFAPSLNASGGFDRLTLGGQRMPEMPQELFITTRAVHSFALAKTAGIKGCDAVIDACMDFLWSKHRDTTHGGYVWGVKGDTVTDATKLAYGHVFVLLAGSSAKMVGHPDADRLIADATEVLEKHFWEDDHGLFADEFNADWTPFSDYRGYNSNMHGTEALLAAFEATGEAQYLEKAGRILDFFTARIAPAHDWRMPEHYTPDWKADLEYQGNPMFRPRGTTPGHSFELGRLLIQWWDLDGRRDAGALTRARNLIYTALDGAWMPGGAFCYTLDYSGKVMMPDRYWWPLTEAIGAVAALIKTDPQDGDEAWYRKLWHCASDLFVDHQYGGWFHELDDKGGVVEKQFIGKMDIYHSLQADLLPYARGVSRVFEGLKP